MHSGREKSFCGCWKISGRVEVCVKKRILFVSHALGKGGSAKALIALLEKLDYDKADVTLKLLAPAGTLR